MALDPRISLAATAPQVPTFNLADTLVQAEQIRAIRQQAQVRQLQLSELLRQRQNELNLQQYNQDLYRRRGIGVPPGSSPTAAPTMAAQVPAALPGTSYAQSPAQASYLDQNLSPRNLAPAGETTYTRAPDALQPPQALPLPATAPRTMATAQGVATAMPGTPPAPAGIDPLAYAAIGGQSGLTMAKTMQDIQAGESERQKDEMTRQLGAMKYLSQVLALPNDDPTYQEMRADLLSKEPRLGKILPERYDPTAIADIQKRLQIGLARGQQHQMGKEIVWGKRGTQDVPMQASTAGGLHEAQLPPGVRPLPPTTMANLGTTMQPVERYGGGVPAPGLPIDIAGKEAQKTQAEVETKYAAQLPERAQQSRLVLRRVDDKHAEAGQKIDQALQLLQSANFPTAGRAAALFRLFGYEPGMNLAANLRSLRAAVGLDELVDLKARGGTLGTVSDAEGNRVESAIANLDPDQQSNESLVKNLQHLKQVLATTKTRLQDAYDEEFIQQRGRQLPSPERGQRRSPTLEDVEAELARRQRSGNAGQ